MSDFKIDEGALVAYADGELNDANASAVEKAILKDPELGLKVKAFKATGQLLKETLGAESQVVPDDLVYRMREIEKKALQESRKKTSDLDKSVESTWNPFSFLIRIFRSNFSSMSFGSGMVSGSLLSGAACAILVISSGIMTSTSIEPTQKGWMYGDQFIQMRSDTPIVYAEQNGLKVAFGGNLKLNQKFTLFFQSPISGNYQIFEVTDTSTKKVSSLKGSIKDGETAKIEMLINDYDTQIGVKIFNDEIVISREIQFRMIK